MRRINKNIVRLLSDKTKCPILELSYDNEMNMWFIIFEEYGRYNGKNKKVHIDDLLKELEEFSNIKCLRHDLYEDLEIPNSYFEQVTFFWKE